MSRFLCVLISAFLLAACQPATRLLMEGLHEQAEITEPDVVKTNAIIEVNHSSEFAGMYIFGEAEKVSVLPQGITFDARLDTGATTTSIHAAKISQFIRDGKKWVRFSLVDPETQKEVELEKPLSRISSTKIHDAENLRRPVVKLKLKMGAVEKVCEVSLTDRAQFKYPLLIGRNFLSNKAVVDVNRMYTGGIQLETD